MCQRNRALPGSCSHSRRVAPTVACQPLVLRKTGCRDLIVLVAHPGAPMGDSGAETRPFTETEEDSSRTRRLGPLKIPGDNRLLHSVTDNPGLLPGASQPAWQPPPGRGGAAGQGGRGLSATESGVDRKRSTTVAYAKQTKAYAFESVKASIRIQRGRKEDFDINRARSHTEKRTVVRARAIERPSSFYYWNLSPSVFNSWNFSLPAACRPPRRTSTWRRTRSVL